MDHIFIKEEIEDAYDTECISVPLKASSSNKSRIPPIAPIQRVMPVPSSMSSRGAAAEGDGNQSGYSDRIQNGIFEREQILDSKPPCLKRKGPKLDLSKFKHHRANPSLMSPPLFPTGSSFHVPKTNNGYQQNGGGDSNVQDGSVSQEDEWRNIKVVRRNINPSIVC